MVVNPNNPDGRVTRRDASAALADRLSARGGLLVVDEAFMEVGGRRRESLAGHAGRAGLVVLRSFGKFFGLPGLRLGFALADPTLAAAIAGRLGPWAVSGPALETGMAALADRDWQAAMRDTLANEASRLDALLAAHGLAVTGGTGLFRSSTMPTLPRLFDTLGAHGILVRNFAGQKQRLRFGLPPDEAGWSRLSHALDILAPGSAATRKCLMTTIHVCPLSQLHATVAATGAGRIVSLLTQGTLVERPGAVALENHLFLSMHDIVEELPDMEPPRDAHVEELIAFARNWDRAKPIVVHCFAGISRSTAAAYIIACVLYPERDEAELAAALRRASPSATPNQRLIALADAKLGRDGRMVSAIAEIGRGVDATEGVPFVLDLGDATRADA